MFSLKVNLTHVSIYVPQIHKLFLYIIMEIYFLYKNACLDTVIRLTTCLYKYYAGINTPYQTVVLQIHQLPETRNHVQIYHRPWVQHFSPVSYTSNTPCSSQNSRSFPGA